MQLLWEPPRTLEAKVTGTPELAADKDCYQPCGEAWVWSSGDSLASVFHLSSCVSQGLSFSKLNCRKAASPHAQLSVCLSAASLSFTSLQSPEVTVWKGDRLQLRWESPRKLGSV